MPRQGIVGIMLGIVIGLALVGTVATSTSTASVALALFSGAQALVIIVPLIFVAIILLYAYGHAHSASGSGKGTFAVDLTKKLFSAIVRATNRLVISIARAAATQISRD